MLRFRRLNILLMLCLSIVITLLILSDEDGIDLRWILAPKIVAESVMIECYKNESWNTLESISSIKIKNNSSIFFVETKCHHNGINLTPRQACAIESAARLNPKLDVYLLIPSPISHSTEPPLKHVDKLFTYSNFKIVHVNMEEYFVGSPLETWYKEGRLRSSLWPQSHASDLLRYTTLWKYGGIYLDLDVVLLRSFENMLNFAGAESSTDVAAGFLSFTKGSKLSSMCITDLRFRFRGYDWGYNGPGVITRTLQKICRGRGVEDMTPENCEGFTVYKPSIFYAIPWRSWKDFFSEDNSTRIMEKLKDSFAIHIWNKHSSKAIATVGSRQPYSQIASHHCPRVYSTIESTF